MNRLDDASLQLVADRLAERADIIAVYCFGSQVDPDCPTPRDVDIGVLARDPLSLDELLRIRADICDVLHRDEVDVVDLRRAGPVLKRQVVARGRMLHCKDTSRMNEFELRALSEYRDSQYRRRLQYKLLRESVAKQ